MDARARDLDNGRKKLEEFRARKAARKNASAAVVKQPATKEDADVDAAQQGVDEDATYTARLEAKLAALNDRGNTVGSIGTPTNMDTSVKMRDEMTKVVDDASDDYSALLNRAASEEGERARSERVRATETALRDANDDFMMVSDAIEALGADKISGEVAGELQRELERLTEECGGEREAARAEIDGLQNELERLRALDSELERAREELIERKANEEAMTKDLETARSELIDKVESLRLAQQEIDSAKIDLEKMKSAVEEAKKTSKEKVKKAIAKGKSIEAEKKTIQAELETMRAQAEEQSGLAQKLADAESKLANAKNELDQAESKLLSFEATDDALSALRLKNQEMQVQLTALHGLEEKDQKREEELAESRATIERLTTDVQELTSARELVDSLKTELEKTKIELEDATSRAASVNEEITTQTEQLRKETATAQERIQQLETEMKEEQTSHENERTKLISQIEDINDKLDASERSVFERDAEIESLRGKIDDVKHASADEVDRLRLDLESTQKNHEEEVKKLSDTLEELNGKLENANSEAQEWRDEKSALEEELKSKDAEISTLTARAEDASASLDANLETLRSQLADVQLEKTAQGQTIAELTDAIRMANEEIEMLTSAKTKLEEEIKVKEEAIGAEKSKLDQAQASVEAELQDARARLDASENEKNVQHEQLMEINARLQEQSAEISDLTAAKAQAEEIIAARDDEIQQLQAKMESTAVDGVREKELESRVTMLEQEKESLQARIKEASSQVENAAQKIAALSEAKALVDADLKAKDDEIARLSDAADQAQKAYQDEVAGLRAQLTASEKETSANVHQMESQFYEVNTRCEQLEQEIASMTDARSRLESELESKTNEIAELRSATDAVKSSATNELSQTQAKLDAVEQEKFVQENQLKEYAERLQSADAELSSMKTEYEKLRISVTEKNQELNQLREQMKSIDGIANEEFERVNREFGELRASHAKLEHEVTELRSMEEQTLMEMNELAEEKNAVIDKLTQELDAVKSSGDAAAQGRIGELNTALGEARAEATSLRTALDEANASLGSMQELQTRLQQTEMNLATSNEAQKDLSERLAEAKAALTQHQQALPSTPPPPTSASRRLPRTPSDSASLDIESGARAESPSKSMRIWRDSRVTGRVPKPFQPVMEFCDNAFVRFFRVMRTQPSLRFAALTYWAVLHAWLFYYIFLSY